MNMTGFRLLGLDIDGTLLRKDGAIAPLDRVALDAAREAGVIVTLLTGRLRPGAMAIASQLGLAGPIACADGASIVRSEDGSEQRYRGIIGEPVQAVRERLFGAPVASFVLRDDRVIVDARAQGFSRMLRAISPEQELVDDVLAHPAWTDARGLSMLVSIGPSRDVWALAEEMAEVAGIRTACFEIARAPGVGAITVHGAGVSKGDALRFIAQHHGLETEQAVTIGDWHNDVTMLKAAGRSYAMGQSPPEVHAAATHSLPHDASTGGAVAEVVAAVWFDGQPPW